jgi:RsiW-degrading membrane proteinase PrsW (M82 family)
MNDPWLLPSGSVRFTYLDDARRVCGPHTREELQQLFEAGVIATSTPVRDLRGEEWFPFAQLLEARAPESGRGPEAEEGAGRRSFREQANDDWRALKRHILVPWNEIRQMRWMDSRRLMGVAAIGLFPLVIIALLTNTGKIVGAFWAMAFYFSALWAVFFYYVFPAPGVTIRNCLICFFGTGLFSISLLQIVYFLLNLAGGFVFPDDLSPARPALERLIQHPYALMRWSVWVFGVGLPEETCKLLVLIYLARNNEPFQPQTMLYFGLMAGLGFGIYEGVAYQKSANLALGGFNVGNYYILNVVRLTALPFIHSIWTAIGGYFIGFAYQYPVRKRGLIIIAIALPTLLHGLYNAVSASSVISSLGVAMLSVLLLNIYLAKCRDFDRVLQQR